MTNQYKEPTTYSWDNKYLTIKQLSKIKGIEETKLRSRINTNDGIVTERILDPEPLHTGRPFKEKEVDAKTAMRLNVLACNFKPAC